MAKPLDEKYRYLNKRRGGDHGELSNPFGPQGEETKAATKKKRRRKRRRKKKALQMNPIHVPSEGEPQKIDPAISDLYRVAIYTNKKTMAVPDLKTPGMVSAGRVPMKMNAQAATQAGGPILGWNRNQLTKKQNETLTALMKQRENNRDTVKKAELARKRLFLGPTQPGDAEYDAKMREIDGLPPIRVGEASFTEKEAGIANE